MTVPTSAKARGQAGSGAMQVTRHHDRRTPGVPRPYVVIIEGSRGPREWTRYSTMEQAEAEAKLLRLHGFNATACEVAE